METSPTGQEFLFSGETTTDEMMRAYKLAWRDVRQMRWRYRGPLIACLLGIIFGFTAYRNQDYEFSVFFWTCTAIGLLSLYTCAIAFRRKVSRQLKHGLFDDRDSITCVDDKGARIVDGISTLEIAWNRFSGVRHNDELAVIYIDYPISFLAFFRRTLEPPSEWNDFVDDLERRLHAQ